MKREMLFRGKRVDTKEWVEGPGINTQYDVNGNEHVYIGVTIISSMYPLMFSIEWFEVIPETVGQYVCISDKHDTKLFEGDIVDIEYVGFTRRYWVKYKESGAWYLLEPIPRRFVDEWLDPEAITYSGEIIGNIYDNPELREVKE